MKYEIRSNKDLDSALKIAEKDNFLIFAVQKLLTINEIYF